MIHGMINVYKEPGFTSFDVVAKLRGMLKQKKIGHTGTLDPMAEGVLVVCLGNATKLCDLITDHDKIYEAEMLLGQTTDTEDITGTVLREREVSVSEEEIRKAVNHFVGTYDQIPPMYSAIRVGGKHLYELARKGVEVERKARTVTIEAIDILSVDLPVVRLRIHCGKGTYIRSLCRDIGERLGCGACMKALTRVKVGKFTADSAHRLFEIQSFCDNGRVEELVLPCDSLFDGLPEVTLGEEDTKRARNGNPLFLGHKEERVRVYLSDHTFVGIYARSDRDLYRVEKLFLAEGE